MDIKYIRDLDHNYLVMEAGPENPFAERMLRAHTPEGMIGFEVRIRNNEPHLFYRTDSLVSLANRTLTAKLSRNEMYALLNALCLAQESLGEYLLDADKLFLSADTVFTNPSTHQWFFLCYPYVHEEEGTPELFLEELTGLISTTDDDAVSEAYALCELVGRKNGRLRDMLKELRQTYDVDADCSVAACNLSFADEAMCVHPGKEMQELYGDKGGDEDGYCSSKRNDNRDFYGDTDGQFEDSARHQKNKSDSGKKYWFTKGTFGRREKYGKRREKGDRSYIITTLLFIVVMLIPVYIRKEYILSEAANIVCSVIMGLCAAGAVGSFLLERRAKAEEENEVEDDYEEDDEGTYAYMKTHADEIANEAADSDAHANPYDRLGNSNYGTTHKTKNGMRKETVVDRYINVSEKTMKNGNGSHFSMSYNPYSKLFENKENEEDDCTVLLTEQVQKGPPKLYGRNRTASTNIILEKLPLTLGTLGGSVDYKLSDKSVSRIHAYIGKNENGHIFLKDLGSTNGTYLNGKRLESNEVCCLNRGDEVRFGAMEFEYI